MKIYIYNQNCLRAGESVSEQTLEQHPDPDNAGDWSVYEGTEAELRERATSLIKSAEKAGAGNDRYRRRVAKTILCAFMREEEANELVYG